MRFWLLVLEERSIGRSEPMHRRENVVVCVTPVEHLAMLNRECASTQHWTLLGYHEVGDVELHAIIKAGGGLDMTCEVREALEAAPSSDDDDEEDQ